MIISFSGKVLGTEGNKDYHPSDMTRGEYCGLGEFLLQYSHLVNMILCLNTTLKCIYINEYSWVEKIRISPDVLHTSRHTH